MSGFVSLVGAGPGSAELLTLKAARRLAEADLVLYDALVDPGVLELAPRAQRFRVGKRAGRPSVRQETIERVMVRAARRGRRVVRLKCGDPFVLGRGGEEALVLAAAGVAFEVVPGVSNAVAAPALSGIPVTHRGAASAFVVVSAHAEAAYAPVLQALAPHSLTVVVLMGLGTRAAVATLLLERGWRASTPAALCLSAGTGDAATWIGTLGELAAAPAAGPGAVPAVPPGAAGTIVIGDVVRVGAQIAASGLARGVAPRLGAVSADAGEAGAVSAAM